MFHVASTSAVGREGFGGYRRCCQEGGDHGDNVQRVTVPSWATSDPNSIQTLT